METLIVVLISIVIALVILAALTARAQRARRTGPDHRQARSSHLTAASTHSPRFAWHGKPKIKKFIVDPVALESAIARSRNGAVAVVSEVTQELYLAFWDSGHDEMVLEAPRNAPETSMFRATDSFLYPFLLLVEPAR